MALEGPVEAGSPVMPSRLAQQQPLRLSTEGLPPGRPTWRLMLSASAGVSPSSSFELRNETSDLHGSTASLALSSSMTVANEMVVQAVHATVSSCLLGCWPHDTLPSVAGKSEDNDSIIIPRKLSSLAGALRQESTLSSPECGTKGASAPNRAEETHGVAAKQLPPPERLSPPSKNQAASQQTVIYSETALSVSPSTNWHHLSIFPQAVSMDDNIAEGVPPTYPDKVVAAQRDLKMLVRQVKKFEADFVARRGRRPKGQEKAPITEQLRRYKQLKRFLGAFDGNCNHGLTRAFCLFSPFLKLLLSSSSIFLVFLDLFCCAHIFSCSIHRGRSTV